MSKEVQLEKALRREARALRHSTPTSISASIKASIRAPPPVTSLRKGFPAFQVAKRQLTIESCGDYQIPGSDFQLDGAQLRQHNKRPVEYQQYTWPTLHTCRSADPEGPRNSQAMLNSILNSIRIL
ncbi:hypothetical protein BPAE_0095g00260 [Botrytis paeoniae]|uniref:Uncharacterized protein n=1 Tax=Botrytis paeoniae TaxID=278948 RepID=A0A4Z1FML8_9HELO|nr:hypothetical protein BPAE_0095g00260 [Botrytis paeoniae]